MDNINEKLQIAIRRSSIKFFYLDHELDDKLIYHTIFDTYFKNLTVEDIKEFVNISLGISDLDEHGETKTASFALKMILHFTKSKRIEILNDFIDKINLEK